MIRPFTCVCLLLAGGAGLFLYQSKHHTRVLDHQIEQTMKQVEAARARIGILQAEWALLNDPQRLAELSDRFLALKPVAPVQFVTLADLDRHLPAPLPPPPAAASESGPAVAAAPADNGAAAPADVADAQPAATGPALPIPPIEPPHPRLALAQAPVPIAKPTPRPAESRRVASRRDENEAEPRTAIARHAPAASEAHRARPAAEPESVVHTTPVPAPIPLWRSAAPPVLATAAPVPATPARPEPAFAAAAPQTTRPVFANTSTPSAAAGSLLGGAHMAVAPPVPISDAAWTGR